MNEPLCIPYRGQRSECYVFRLHRTVVPWLGSKTRFQNSLPSAETRAARHALIRKSVSSIVVLPVSRLEGLQGMHVTSPPLSRAVLLSTHLLLFPSPLLSLLLRVHRCLDLVGKVFAAERDLHQQLHNGVRRVIVYLLLLDRTSSLMLRLLLWLLRDRLDPPNGRLAPVLFGLVARYATSAPGKA